MGCSGLERMLELVTNHRLRSATAGAMSPLIASESDKGRVVNSAAFRRLQQKAQVFPLDPNAAVRTRLTHSIEVAQVGRYLTQKVVQKLGADQGSYPVVAALVNVVETACLLHDIGNPPFGHLGEASIREWFSRRNQDDELKSFDGNPQGFRLVSFLSGMDKYGLNLTCSLLLSTVKYPWTGHAKPDGAGKIGVFGQDWDTYNDACEMVRWPAGRKFPFLRLMESADDIAYSMSDLEDGVEKGILGVEELKTEFGAEYFSSPNVYPTVAFKTNVINAAVDAAARVFTESLDDILDGSNVELLPEKSQMGDLLRRVKEFAREKVYSHPAAERIELAGRSVIRGLLTHFGELLDLDEERFTEMLDGRKRNVKGREFHIRLLRILPTAYKEKYRAEERGSESARRAHLIVDFIAGMTDDFALDTYRMLEGIRIR